jgi:hypothetical protein
MRFIQRNNMNDFYGVWIKSSGNKIQYVLLFCTITKLHCSPTLLHCCVCQKTYIYDYILSYWSEIFFQFLFLESIMCEIFVSYDHVEDIDIPFATN